MMTMTAQFSDAQSRDGALASLAADGISAQSGGRVGAPHAVRVEVRNDLLMRARARLIELGGRLVETRTQAPAASGGAT